MSVMSHIARPDSAFRGAVPCVCDLCGETLPSKGARRRHKANGCTGGKVIGMAQDDRCEDENLYGRVTISPEIRARAAAEWAALDDRGRLPEGWSFTPAAAGSPTPPDAAVSGDRE